VREVYANSAYCYDVVYARRDCCYVTFLTLNRVSRHRGPTAEPGPLKAYTRHRENLIVLRSFVAFKNSCPFRSQRVEHCCTTAGLSHTAVLLDLIHCGAGPVPWSPWRSAEPAYRHICVASKYPGEMASASQKGGKYFTR